MDRTGEKKLSQRSTVAKKDVKLKSSRHCSERESAATFPGVERRSNLPPRCLDESRWLQETGNPKEEEKEEEEACVIKRCGERKHGSIGSHSSVVVPCRAKLSHCFWKTGCTIVGQGLGIVPPGNTRGAAADFRLLSSERGQTRRSGEDGGWEEGTISPPRAPLHFTPPETRCSGY